MTLWPLRLVSLLQVPLPLADESDDELVNAFFRSGKWKDHKDAQRVTIRLFDGASVAANCNGDRSGDLSPQFPTLPNVGN